MNAKTQNEKALDTRDLVEAWARERLLTGGSKPRSIRSDKYRVMRFIHFIEAESLDLAYVDEQTIWNYQGSLLEKKHAHHDKSLGKKTIASIMASLQSFGDFLVARGFWLNNLVKPVKLSTHAASPPVDVPDESTMEAFMTELGKWWEDENLRAQMTSFRFYVIAELQYATGLRAGEVADLEEGDLDLRSLEVRVRAGKGGKDRIVFLTHWAAELLHEFLGLRQLIVRGAETTKRLFGLDQSTITTSYNAWLNVRAQRVGIGRWYNHKFRHALGYHLLRSGCSLRYIQGILGHEKIRTTEIYTKVDSEDVREVLDAYHPRGA
jgi:integrase/recombinase XerD